MHNLQIQVGELYRLKWEVGERRSSAFPLTLTTVYNSRFRIPGTRSGLYDALKRPTATVQCNSILWSSDTATVGLGLHKCHLIGSAVFRLMSANTP